MATATKQNWNWRAEGFASEPTGVVLRGPVTLYRVWGGMSTELGSPTRPGVCFSLEQPRTRREAEELFSVWEWGNACRFVSRFQVWPSATIFVGQAHPGDFHDHGLGEPGSQVFIEIDDVRRFVQRIGTPVSLLDDLGSVTVVPNPDPGKAKSS